MEMVKKVSVSPVQATASDEGALPFPFGHTHAHIVVAVVAYSSRYVWYQAVYRLVVSVLISARVYPLSL